MFFLFVFVVSFQGDRVGICLLSLDPKVMERGFLAKPGTLFLSSACLLSSLHLIGYFKGKVASKARFHISIGQDTVLARITCLQRTLNEGDEYEYLPELCSDGESCYSIDA